MSGTDQALEFLKITGDGFNLFAWYTATLVKTLAWPATVGGIVWVLRNQIRVVVERIEQLVVEHKDTKIAVQIGKQLEKVAEAVTDPEQKVRLAATATIQSSATAKPTLTTAKAEEAKALRNSMGRDLETLEDLAKLSATIPRSAIEQSWDILKQNVVATAKLTGLAPRSEGETRSELERAVYHLTLGVINSQEIMTGAYWLRAALQKVEKNPDAEVPVKNAQDFVRYCMALVATLSFEVDEVIGRETRPS